MSWSIPSAKRSKQPSLKGRLKQERIMILERHRELKSDFLRRDKARKREDKQR